MRLKDKVAIITGAAQGIGRVIAETFLKEGANVVLADMDEALVQKTAGEIEQTAGAGAQGGGTAVASGTAIGMKCNVTDAASVDGLIKATIDKFSKIDILVNNAGITKDNLFIRMSEAEWDAVLAVNLKGAFLCSKAAARHMMRAHFGRIINIASVVGEEGNIGQGNYAASKGGLIAFTKSCAKELATRNVLCNAIAPGFIKTRLTDAISPEAKEYMMRRILLGRIGEPLDVAKAALFLASDDASYITGQVLNVNGGMYL